MDRLEKELTLPQYDLNEEQEKKEIVRRYRALLRVLKPKLKQGDKELVRTAFEMSVDAHKTMRRKSGEPYIFHPLAVAMICVEEVGLGVRSCICALLHDTVEDTDVTLEDIQQEFGEEIARIIDGLTKIATVVDNNSSQQAENFKKILLTLTGDPRASNQAMLAIMSAGMSKGAKPGTESGEKGLEVMAEINKAGNWFCTVPRVRSSWMSL